MGSGTDIAIESGGIVLVQNDLMAYLQDLAQKQGSKNVELKLKKKDLASYLGITAETLSRKLKNLQKENRIKISGRRIILL